MKMYEGLEADRKIMPLLPVLARVDGRCFSSFTRGMDRPYDHAMTHIMQQTTLALIKETNACAGYTQSDEITLAWHSTNIASEIWFNGRICKMVSQLGALATLYFYRLTCEHLPSFANRMPTFDARVWQVPNQTEGANAFLWREWDASKNSITMAAREFYSDKQLHGKNGSEKQELLFQKGVNWDAYPASFKRGTFVQRRTVQKPFNTEELDKLPPNHAARQNPNLVVERSEIQMLEMPPFGQVTNREAVIFSGAEPQTLKQTASQ